MWIRIALCALLVFVPLNRAISQKPKTINITNGYLKAQEFLKLNEFQKTAFAWGFVDGLDVAPLLDAPEDGKFYVDLRSCLAEMPGEQVAAIIEKHVRDNPESWHKQLHTIAFNALLKACNAM